MLMFLDRSNMFGRSRSRKFNDRWICGLTHLSSSMVAIKPPNNLISSCFSIACLSWTCFSVFSCSSRRLTGLVSFIAGFPFREVNLFFGMATRKGALRLVLPWVAREGSRMCDETRLFQNFGRIALCTRRPMSPGGGIFDVGQKSLAVGESIATGKRLLEAISRFMCCLLSDVNSKLKEK